MQYSLPFRQRMPIYNLTYEIPFSPLLRVHGTTISRAVPTRCTQRTVHDYPCRHSHDPNHKQTLLSSHSVRITHRHLYSTITPVLGDIASPIISPFLSRACETHSAKPIPGYVSPQLCNSAAAPPSTVVHATSPNLPYWEICPPNKGYPTLPWETPTTPLT